MKRTIFALLLVIAVCANSCTRMPETATREKSFDFKNINAVRTALLEFIYTKLSSHYDMLPADIESEEVLVGDNKTECVFLVTIHAQLKPEILAHHPVLDAVEELVEVSDKMSRTFLESYRKAFSVFLEEYSRNPQSLCMRVKVYADASGIDNYVETARAKEFVSAEEALTIESFDEIKSHAKQALLKILQKMAETGKPNLKYTPENAIRYAITYTSNTKNQCSESDPTYYDPAKYNSEFQYYECNDCANFVSQCLVAGGVQEDSVFYKYSVAWRYVDFLGNNDNDLYSYLVNKNAVETFTRTLVLPGSVALLDWNNNNSPDHAMLVTYSDGYLIFASAHTSDRKNSILPESNATVHFLLTWGF